MHQNNFCCNFTRLRIAANENLFDEINLCGRNIYWLCYSTIWTILREKLNSTFLQQEKVGEKYQGHMQLGGLLSCPLPKGGAREVEGAF